MASSLDDELPVDIADGIFRRDSEPEFVVLDPVEAFVEHTDVVEDTFMYHNRRGTDKAEIQGFEKEP